MASKAKKRLVIIDGKSVFYRGYYAMPYLSKNDGTPTGGVYGFAVLALEIIKRLEPEYVCVAWDKSKTSTKTRSKLYPEYKAGRKTPPEDFFAQIPILQELLASFSWPFYEIDDYEADDIMATLAVKAEAKGLETLLITSDLDLLQCVSDSTKMYALKKGLSNIQEFTPKAFEEKYSISVKQFIDLKSLKGDSSDNIPGVKGIGEKTAVQLLNEYQTLDNIYDNLDLIKESTRKKLEQDKDMAYLSKKLVTLYLDAPVELDLKAMDVKDLDAARLRKDLLELEFTSLLRQLPKEMMDAAEPISVPQNDIKLPMPKIVVHNDLKDFHKLDFSKPIFVHSFCNARFGKEPAVILASDDPEILHVYAAKGKLDIDTKFSIFGYDTKKQIQVLWGLGAKSVTVEHDTLVAAFLLNSLIRDQSLSAIANSDLGYDSELDSLDEPNFRIKAPEICAVMYELRKVQQKALKKLPKVQKLAEDIEWPVIPVLARIELNGMKLDTDYLAVMHDDLTGKISDLEQTIYGYADEEFNISSPAQLAEILYTKLALPTQGVKRGKTSYSTAANELAKLKGLHPIVEHISEYRELTKLKSTYVDALPNHVDDDGRVRSDLRLTIAPTGRLSSSDPNLQNIPVRTEIGKQIRNAFIADDNNVLVSADYSQFELRLAAFLADDEDMIEAFNSDIDIHTLTASQVFGVALDDVSKEMRYNAKAVNFGLLYGQGSHGLAQQTGMSYGEAKEFIDKYFEKRIKLRDYMAKLREQAKNDGYVETFFGRRRPTPDVKSSNFVLREAAYRQAINMPIQGTEADLMKMAMVKINNKLDAKSRQIMQVHDSIIVECPEFEAEKVARMMKAVMEDICSDIKVKLKVDVEIGKTWGDL